MSRTATLSPLVRTASGDVVLRGKPTTRILRKGETVNITALARTR